MSNMIEKEVVKMEFDNSDFEKKTKESMSTIEKLKKALNFDTAKETLSNFAKQANELDFNGLKDSVDTIAKRFSNLGIVGMTVVSRLTNALVDGVKKISSSITGMIASGGLSRAMNIEKAKFQLEGLGIAWDDIKEDIDYGVKDTAYGLDAAASAAAQLSASGVQIGEEMKTSLRAISGVAAMTGASYDEIARVFEAGAGQGRVMMGELTRLAERGVNATAVLAKALGKTEAEIREMASDSQIDFMTFAKAMDDAFGQHAKDANKTLNGTLDNIRSAWSRVGAEFIQPIIRNEGELVQLLNAYREKINDIKEAIIPVAQQTTTLLNQVIASFTRTIQGIDIKERVKKIGEGIADLINAFQKLFTRISFVGRKIGEVFREVFPKKEAKDITASFAKITKAIGEFNVNNKVIEKLQSVFKGLFSIIKVGETVFKNLFVIVKPIFKYIVSEAKNMLDIAAYMGDAISKLVDGTFKFEDAATMVSTVLENIETGLKWIKLGFKELMGDTEDTIEVMEGVSLRGLEIIQGVLHIVQGLVSAIATAVGTVFGLNTDTINSYIVSLFDKIENFFKELFWIYQEAGGGAEGFAAIFSSVIYTISKKITEFIEKVTGINLEELKNKIDSFLKNATTNITKFLDVVKPITKIGDAFKFVKDRVVELANALTGVAQSAAIGLGKMLENPIGSVVGIHGAMAVIDRLNQFAREGAIGSLIPQLFDLRKAFSSWTSSMNATQILKIAGAIVALGVAFKIMAVGVAELASVPHFENTFTALKEMLVAMGGIFIGLAIVLNSIKDVNFKGDTLTKPIDKLKASFKLTSGKILATAVLVVSTAAALKILVDALTEIASLDAGVTNHIAACVEIFGLLLLLGEAMKKLSKMKPAEGINGKFFLIYAATLVMTAEAVKIMAEAFTTLNSELVKIKDIGDLVDALLSFGIIIGIMASLVYSLNKIKITNVQNLVALGIGIFAIAEGVSVLVKAIAILKDLDAEQALMGLVSVFALLQAVMRGAYLLAGSAISLKTSVALIAMAAALAIIVHQINVLANTPFDDIVKGFTTIVGILGTFTIVASFFASELKSLSVAGLAMLEFAASIWIVTKAIKDLASIPIDIIAERMIVLLSSIVAFSVMINTFNLGNATSGLGILEIAGAVFILAEAIKLLSSMDITDILKGGVPLIIFIGTLAAITAGMTTALPGAQAMLVVAASLGVLAIAVKLLADTKGWMFAAVIVMGALVAALFTLGVSATVTAPAIEAGATVIAAACGILAAGLLLVVGTIAIFAISMAAIAISGVGAAEGLSAFGKALFDLTIKAGTNIKTMGQLAIVMIKTAKAMLIGGMGLISLGVGLVAFGAGALVGAAGALALAAGLGALALALQELVNVLQVAGLSGVVEQIGMQTGVQYAQSTAKGINSGSSVVSDAVKKLVKDALVGLMDHTMGINSPSTVMAERGMYIDMGLAEGMLNNQDVVRQASEQLGKTTSTSLTTSLTQGTQEGSKTLTDAVKIFSDVTSKGSVAAGQQVGNGFIQGLHHMSPKVKQYAANLGKSAYMAMKQYLKIKSPSRLMMELGEYTGEGFVIGMQNTETNVEDSAQDLGKTASNSLTTALSAAYNNLTSGIEDPTIKPVLDLSEIQNGASNIDSMLSRDFASNISANYRSNRDYADEQTQANASLMSGLNDRLVSALMATGGSDLPINLNVQLVGDAAGVFRLVQAENQRMTNMYGSSPLMRG